MCWRRWTAWRIRRSCVRWTAWTAFAARKAIVAELERLGLLEKIEPYTHQVPHGDRGGVPIEPLLTTQWYCNAEVLAKPAIEAVETGKTVFVPKQWENTFFAWMRDIQPWCISRQLWWGHQHSCLVWPGRRGVRRARPRRRRRPRRARNTARDEALTQDEDVLDTWFSSGLWPFSTLGWPEQTKELARYYPGDVLVTGFDIIFFWVARMMMQGIHFMGEVPFRTVYIHGLVRDERGQKMSKSKGNIIDPLELIDRYGADALRFTICALTGPGRDVKLGAARVESYRRFVTKLWNAARFCEMNGIRPDASFDPSRATLPLTRWILDAMNRAIAEASAALEAYRFDEYAAACYRFTWDTFCDWFVEFAKPVLAEGDATAARCGDRGVCARHHPAAAASGDAVRHRGAVGSLRLRRTMQPDPRAVARAGYRARCGGGARRARLGGAADLRGALGAHRDERAARHADADPAARCRAGDAGARAALDGGDPASGARIRVAGAGGRDAEGLGAAGAG